MYIIFTDVDGTLIDNNLNLLDQTKIDIQHAQQKGIKVAICTGNSHFENMTKLAKKIDAEFLITSDGARIYDFKSQKIIYQKVIKKDKANWFVNKIKHLVYFMTWTTEKKLFINVANQEYKNLAIKINKKFHCRNETIEFQSQIDNDIYKMSCFSSKENLDAMEEQAKKYQFNYLRHNDNFMSFSPNDSNKGEAVKALSILMNTSLDNVMTIGDGANDISMIKITSNSYAMGNGINSLKAIANHHTSSVEQNGLGEAIVDFMFRKKI